MDERQALAQILSKLAVVETLLRVQTEDIKTLVASDRKNDTRITVLEGKVANRSMVGAFGVIGSIVAAAVSYLLKGP